jgi:8-oxo-dGTP pyrophosphatase MutT (NUDIX family)
MKKHRHFHLGVKAIIRNQQGKILLLKKSPHKLYGNPPHWDLPGGRLEKTHSIKETLLREIAEETGITSFKNQGLFYAVVSNIKIKTDDCGLILFIYDCRVPKTISIKLNDEHTEYSWFPPHKAAKLLKIKYPADFTKKLNHI